MLCTYTLIPKLEQLADILPTNLTVIAWGAAVGAALGKVPDDTNLDIWCLLHALPHLCCLLEAEEIMLIR